jgi:hypothetical protein
VIARCNSAASAAHLGPAAQGGHDSGNSDQPQALKDGNFHRRTPLWYYLLAEAKHHGGGNR